MILYQHACPMCHELCAPGKCYCAKHLAEILTHPFGSEYGIESGTEDRCRRVAISMDCGWLARVLALPPGHLQKTVRQAAERRLRKISAGRAA